MAKRPVERTRSRVRGPDGPGRYPCQIVFGTSADQAAEIEQRVQAYEGRLSRSAVMRAVVASALQGDIDARLARMVSAQSESGS